MKFTSTPLKGAYTIELEKRGDERGFFARYFCSEEFEQIGLETKFIQMNDSFSADKATLRGMHFQVTSAAEVKVVRCLRGAIYDVILDIRNDSSTFGRWFAHELTAENRSMMYCPRGFAHGFMTLVPDSEILYMVSSKYSPENERGIRWNDPRFGIEWPMQPLVMSERDKNLQDYLEDQ